MSRAIPSAQRKNSVRSLHLLRAAETAEVQADREAAAGLAVREAETELAVREMEVRQEIQGPAAAELQEAREPVQAAQEAERQAAHRGRAIQMREPECRAASVTVRRRERTTPGQARQETVRKPVQTEILERKLMERAAVKREIPGAQAKAAAQEKAPEQPESLGERAVQAEEIQAEKGIRIHQKVIRGKMGPPAISALMRMESETSWEGC